MPATKAKSVAARKSAQQDRSKAKVRLILDTVLTMLNDGPADRITTNEIAKQAGISIGTLYQYFPKKEAIFYALFQEWLQDTLDRLDAVGARFSGSEDLPDLADAIFDGLSSDDAINSRGHWQLLRAMGSTEELAALEADHQREVFQRIIAFQEKFGRSIQPAQAKVLATLQHHVTVGCLATAAQIGDHPERQAALDWGRKTMRFIYDIDRLNA